MARQGSLRHQSARYRCDLPVFARGCALAIGIVGWLIGSATTSAGQGEMSSIDIRITVEFQSPAPQPWNLRLRLEDSPNHEADFSEIRNLCESGLSSGIFDLDRSGKMLTLHSRHAIADGKFEVRIRGSRGAKLLVEPCGKSAENEGMPTSRELAITDLLGVEPIQSPAPPVNRELAASWTIHRSDSDALRIEDLSPIPIYHPGSPLNLSLRANGMIGHASEAHVLSYQLCRVSDGEIVQSHRWPIQIDAYGNSRVVALNETLPEVAGVYELRLQVEADEGNIWSRLRRRPSPLVKTSRPIAVLHADMNDAPEQVPWQEVGIIRPTESSWSMGQWLPKPTTRLIPGAAAPPAIPDLESDSHDGQSVSLLPPSGTFQATLPVRTPGYPHKVTIKFPSNSTTSLQIQVGSDQQDVTTSFVIENDPTADQQGPWRQHTFVHYPVDGDQIWLTNLDPANRTSFESITVHSGPLYLAPERAPSLAPASSSRTAALRLEDIDWCDALTADVSKRTKLSEFAAPTISLNRLWVAAERIQDYARASGFNGIVVPANRGAQAWYESSRYQSLEDSIASRSRYIETLLELLEPSQLRVYVGLNPDMLLTELERTIHDQESLLIELTRSASSVETTPESKNSSTSTPSRTQYNPLHPLVQNALGDLVKELSDRCDQYKGFAGIIVDCDGDSHLRPLQNAAADSGAILLFGRTNHISANVAQLRSWIQQQGSESFQNWEQQQLQSGFDQVRRTTGAGMVSMLMPGTTPAEFAVGINGSPPLSTSEGSGRPLPSSASLIGSFRYGPAAVLSRYSWMQQQLSSITGPLPGALFGAEPAPSTPSFVRDQMVGDLCRLMDHADPSLLIVDHELVANHLNSNLSRSMESFCALPDQRFQASIPIDSASHTVKLRSGTFDGHLYVSMINVVPWTSDVDLETTAPVEWVVVGPTITDDAKLAPLSGGTHTRVTVPTGQMVVLRSRQPSSASIRSWTTRVSGGPEAIESIKQKVTLIVERIGILSDFQPYSRLTNGGFEHSGGMGLVGWLHAQHPPGCVQIDDQEFAEGSHSVMLTTDAPAVARTWLVSETIEPPQSGRLAVSLACRAEATSEDSPHLLRVSIEATRQGDPVRFTRELEVPRNGQWRPREVILEADEIDTSSIESLRLTIDSLSGGRVWIDDVQLHDRFPTTKERAELQSQAFLAVQGLQRGNLLPSGKLLQNHWARRLLSLGPTEQSKRVIETLPIPSEAPGVAERIRNWLPRPLRF